MTWLLLKIKKIFKWLGVEIAFVKKKNNIEAILHNSKENMNAFGLTLKIGEIGIVQN